MQAKTNKSRKLLSGLALGLAGAFLLGIGALPASSNSEDDGSEYEIPQHVRLKMSGRRPVHAIHKMVNQRPSTSIPNTLLVMPNKDGGIEALQKVRELNGTIVRTIGAGALTTWVVQFENTEKFIDAEKKLSSCKKLRSVRRDFLFQPQALNDPYYPSQWYIANLKIEGAWNQSLGSENIIGVIDSGTSLKNLDLAGKVFAGYDAVKLRETQKDANGHGTMVATTAAATGDNGLLTAGPARRSKIFPVRAGFANGSVSTSAILEGVYQCGQRGIKIINLSVNSPPSSWSGSIAHPSNTIMHDYFRDFHDAKGGLIFNAAGNEAEYDASPMLPFLIVVSAIQEDLRYTYFSNYGNCIWFTAPGQNIACSSKKGKGNLVSVAGTSFSSPLVCAVAALVWGAKPTKTNTQIETILKQTAINNPVASGVTWNMDYGYGRPDASAAMARP